MPLFEKGALVEPRLIAIFSRRSFATVSARSVKSPQPRVGDVVAFDAVAKQKKKKKKNAKRGPQISRAMQSSSLAFPLRSMLPAAIDLA